jgi:DNA mismatch repair protein MutS2
MYSKKAEEDLEFGKVKGLLSQYCHTESGKERAKELAPSTQADALLFDLNCVNEYLLSYEEVSIPSLQADEVRQEIARLNIKNSVVDAEGLMKINDLCKGIHRLLGFLEKHQELYPHLKERFRHLHPDLTVSTHIEHVLSPHGEVKSSASPALASIRRKMGSMRKEIERNFSGEIQRYRAAGFLDDTKESYINGRRVLAVPAEHKRKIKGTLFGTSNSGKLVYIEPSVNAALNNDLAYLIQEEQDEIYRILLELCDIIRNYLEPIQAWQYALVDLDLVQARALLAKNMGACLPQFIDKPVFELIDAYHPVLLTENRQSKAETKPQSVRLDGEKRIMVISGPNAGGKSITLKTVGLIQWMFQSGLLVPVNPGSRLGIFHKILTDIGDNQSIENKLSTYSYRLQNMKQFLDVADYQTLFLIDEFGTGSDPELGGALAEVFFEELYQRDSIGVITTHYANIKILADKLKYAVNTSMLFNRETLEPLFKLSVGQPGSSFTFEVAKKNEIPDYLIDEAKTRVSTGKLQLDTSIAALHAEREKWVKKVAELNKQKEKARKKADDHDFRREEYEFKIMRLQQTQQENNDHIKYGKKLEELLASYNGKNIKKVIASFVKYLKIEFTKRQEKETPKKEKTLAPIEKQRAKLNTLQPAKNERPERPLKPGDKVCIDQGKEVGIIDVVKGKNASVIFGSLKTTVALSRLRLPGKKKKA